MINRITLFLGPQRLRALFLLLAGTGLASLILNAVSADAETQASLQIVQTLLALIFVGGAVGIVISAMSPFERGRWIGILAPSLGMVALGLLFLPHLSGLLLGGAVGWALAGATIFRPRTPMQYQEAVKHLRKNEYEQAVRVMDALIREESKQPNHYRFRAEILRVWGKLALARRDYKKMTELAPDSAVAYNGLAEVYLQEENFSEAHKAALTAYNLAPGEWVAAYNLGMIEDRLNDSRAVIQHLEEALKARVPDARHRLLIYFYLMRAHTRLGDLDAAKALLSSLKKQRDGLREWQTILQSDQAQTLRDVIEADVNAAGSLINETLSVNALADSQEETMLKNKDRGKKE